MCRLALLLGLAFCLTLTTQVTAADSNSAASNDLTINQWVLPTDAGTLKGRVVTSATDGNSVAVAKARVAIVSKDGEVFQSDSLTNAKGEFVIQDVKPGVYALSARSGNLLAACAMHVLAEVDGVENQFATEVEVSAAAIDYETFRSAVVRYLPALTKPNETAIASVVAKEVRGQLAEQVVTPESFRVAQVNGGMLGQIYSAGLEGETLPTANTTNVFIMKDGKEVARTITDQNGAFEIATLARGTYSLMAIGPQGLGVAGFELVDENSLKTSDNISSDGKRYVGLLSRLRAKRCARKFAMQCAPVCNTCDTCTTCEAPAAPVVFQPIATVIATPVAHNACGCGQPVASCGCGIPVDPCGCSGGMIADAGYVDGTVVDGAMLDGMPIEGEIIDGGIIDGGIIDGGFVDGVPIDGFGSGLAGSGGYTPGFGGGGGSFGGGGGGGGGLLGGGGLGAIGALAGIGGLIAATTNDDDDNVIVPAPIASPVVPN